MASIFEMFNSRILAAYWANAGTQRTYIGTGLFPAAKKAGLDLAWIKGSGGLPISLMPSAFDAKATFRDRVGVQKIETEMPFFREAYHIGEKERQELLRAADANNPYATAILSRIYDDVANLVEGARVVSERMIFSLLFPTGGDMGISITANGVDYTYDYDPSDVWKGKNYKALTSTALWTAATTAKPIDDILKAKSTVAANTGATIKTAIMNETTFSNMIATDNVKNRFLTVSGVNSNAVMLPNDAKNVVESSTGVKIVVYNEQYRKEDKTAAKYVPDGYVSFIPDGKLGNTWYGTTPEEADLMAKSGADVSIVNTGVALNTVAHPHTVSVDIFASEIVLPSFERMDDVYVLKAHA